MFDLLISKWGRGSPVGFLPTNFQFATPILDLGPGTGEIDRQTDGRRPPTLNARPFGAGHNNMGYVNLKTIQRDKYVQCKEK